ncbi:MAG: glycosyltransferase family 39 protein [Alphaproteobacteria bacterium]|nr:glycosyltransferase family 39 protein [Alphaproteobacteria bacterium]
MRLKLSSPAAIAVIIFLLAFGVRLVFALQWHGTPYGGAPLLDAASYHQWAQDIAKGHLFRARAFYQSPLYPYVLGGLYALFGPSPLLASLFNAVLGAAACSLLGLIAFGAFGPLAALATGLLAAFNKQMIFYTAPVMKEPLGLFLLAVFLLLALRALRKKEPFSFFGSGFLLGLSALVRGNAVFLFPAFLGLVFWEAFRHRPFRKTAVKNGALFVLAFLLPVLPVTLHNAVASRDFVPVNYADGFNLYIGHFAGADGVSYAFPEKADSDPALEELNTTWLASREAGRNLSPSEVSGYWRTKALEAIANDPAREFRLMGNKLAGLWNNAEAFDNYDVPFIEKNFTTILNAPLPGFWSLALLAPLGAVAFAAARRRTVTALLFLAAAYAASLLVFYVTDRYRLPLLVFLLPLAGAAPVGMWRLMRANKDARLALAVIVAVLSFGASIWPRAHGPNLEAYDWAMLGKIETERGRYAEALTAVNKALSINPRTAGSTAYAKGAYAKEQLGRRTEAENLLKRGLSLFPEDATLVYEYGRFKAAGGDLAAAEALLKKAAEMSPYYLLAYYGRAMVLIKLGKHAEARKTVAQGLAVDPADPLLLSARKILQE